MIRYVVFRLLWAVLLLNLVLGAVFLMLHLTGDPALILMPEDSTMEEINHFRQIMGFNDPLWVQYGRFFRGVMHGDFGTSFQYNVPAMRVVMEHLPATLKLASAAYLISILVAFPTGLLSAAKRRSYWDRGFLLGTAFLQSVPDFWLGLVLILFFAAWLRWLPAFGEGNILHLIMPAVTASAYLAGRLSRLIRISMLDVMRREYITTARSKGLWELRVVALHALRNASLPLVTVLGTDFGVLLGGTVVTEVVFAWPGVGSLTVQAIYNRDFAIVQATVFLLATFFVLINLVVDLLYGFLDPRVQIAKE